MAYVIITSFHCNFASWERSSLGFSLKGLSLGSSMIGSSLSPQSPQTSGSSSLGYAVIDTSL